MMFARMYFYSRHKIWKNTVAGYSYEMFNGTSNQVFTAALEIYYLWHNQRSSKR
jgi:hypothetical protein